MLKLEDKWVWDFWFAQDGPDYHIFYLQSRNDLPKESLRHWHVSIGHAVSRDLVNWEILPDALHPSAQTGDSWDNASTWTGSIIRHNGTWYLFYTGAKTQEKGLVQRIGLATSSDLITWQKHPGNPLIMADPTWYELLDLEMWHDQAWRDPWVFELNGRFHAFITARSNQGHKSERGVIGHATSDDLLQWQVAPPIAAPHQFGHMEVPQLVEINGRFYLLFCVGHGQYADARRNNPLIAPETGTHYLVADQPLGPYTLLTDNFLLGNAHGSHYAGKLIQMPDGQWALMTWLAFTATGDLVGTIADPLPVHVAPDGRLVVTNPPSHDARATSIDLRTAV
ncbi:MAG: family 43 glycosylhydrolase [Candidatus Promineifilaceae bacterium]|nr:family 43 glycosylhydrolase [Anaerolineaceae bacterium]